MRNYLSKGSGRRSTSLKSALGYILRTCLKKKKKSHPIWICLISTQRASFLESCHSPSGVCLMYLQQALTQVVQPPRPFTKYITQDARNWSLFILQACYRRASGSLPRLQEFSISILLPENKRSKAERTPPFTGSVQQQAKFSSKLH